MVVGKFRSHIPRVDRIKNNKGLSKFSECINFRKRTNLYGETSKLTGNIHLFRSI